ncbi:maltose acetyltransferase domain-containing protein [Secundilactobacillus paracollinoides]|nr:maltose acetyltransferase domain-containing protein [Secundilactobacillus paracollinoides]
MTTEWEKCLNGDLYDAHDATFKTHKAQTYTFLNAYNQTAYDSGQLATNY